MYIYYAGYENISSEVIAAWALMRKVIGQNSSRIHKYNDKNFTQLRNYLVNQQAQGEDFVIFEHEKTGQYVVPDRRKKLMALKFVDGKFSEILTRGYNMISKVEKILLESEAAPKPRVNSQGTIVVDSKYETVQDGIAEELVSDPKMTGMMNSKKEFKFKWSALFLDGSDRVKLNGFIVGKGIGFVKLLARQVLEKMARYGYRFTSLKTLKRFDKRDRKPKGEGLLYDEFFTRDGDTFRKDLKQYRYSLALNYKIIK